MYDVTRPHTFKSLEKWFQLMSEHGRGDVEVAVVSVLAERKHKANGILNYKSKNLKHSGTCRSLKKVYSYTPKWQK